MSFASISDMMVAGDPEFGSCTPHEKLIWLLLCGWPQLIRRHGIFKREGAIVALSDKAPLPREDVEIIFLKFESMGWLVVDGDYCWAVNKIKFSDCSPRWIAATLREVDLLCPQTALAKACIARYDPLKKKIHPHEYEHYYGRSNGVPPVSTGGGYSAANVRMED